MAKNELPQRTMFSQGRLCVLSMPTCVLTPARGTETVSTYRYGFPARHAPTVCIRGNDERVPYLEHSSQRRRSAELRGSANNTIPALEAKYIHGLYNYLNLREAGECWRDRRSTFSPSGRTVRNIQAPVTGVERKNSGRHPPLPRPDDSISNPKTKTRD